MMADVLRDRWVFRQNFERSKGKFAFNKGRQCYVMASYICCTNNGNKKSVGKKDEKAGS